MAKKRKSVLYIIFSILLSIILFPIKLVKNFFLAILKRLKFSIAFKISASYFLLYIVIVLIVTVTSSIGYFVFLLNDFKNSTVDNDISKISESIDSLSKGLGNTSHIDSTLNNDSIKDLTIYDSDYLNLYSLKEDSKKYTNNIISILEEIVKNSIYVYSEEVYENYQIYYVNIYYNVSLLVSQTFYIAVLIFLSSSVGILLFIPIVSKTSTKLIKPIKNMTQIAKTITVSNINTRLDVKGTQDELKELSMTFNDMMDRIENGYKSQQQFVSDASHELRTPIAVLKGYVNMLDRWGKNDKAVLEEAIAAVKNETDNMQDLVEKLLFIARSDKQTLTFTKEDFNISEILFEIEKETLMIDNKHEFEFRFMHDAHVYADKNWIKQAVRIFIENAIKFTPEKGKISVYGFLADGFYAIRIKDTGIGIDKKDLPKIFDRLYRAEESRNRQIGGHGLGLSIAKIIIIGHKGKIKVKSIMGEGAEFTILLPHL
jgi:signal transduction histidine kinase